MKKLLTAAAIITALGGTAAHAGGTITYFDGFQGGCEIYGGYLSPATYGIIAQADPGSATVCATGLAAFENRESNVTLEDCWNVNWGCTTYGGNSITNVELNH